MVRRSPEPTLADVAARCLCSVSAVSLALHREARDCKLAAATRERIIAAARELGYRPHWAGRALQAQRSGLVGALHVHTRHALNVFSSQLLGHLAEALQVDGRDLVLVPVTADGGWRKRLLDRRLDAAVVLGDLGAEALAGIECDILPRVHLNAPDPDARPSAEPHVGFDEDHAVATVCDHLVARGRRRIAWIGMLPGGHHSAGPAREEAYRRWCRSRGRPVVVTSCETLVAAHLAANPAAPDAVACFCDDLAMALLRECWHAGIAVPQDLAVTGINDLEHTALAIPSLTTLRLPVREAAWRSSRCIDTLLAGRRPRSTTLRGELVVRASTTPESL